MHKTISLVAIFLCGMGSTWLHAEPEEYDVLVYGATPAGVCAAVAAAREGASVGLVSPYDYVGGMVSGGLSLSDGNQCVRELMGGLFVEVHERIYQHYEDAGVKLNYQIDLTRNDKWTYEPHVAEKVFHDMIKEAGVTVHLGHQLVSVTREGARIKTLKTSKGVFQAEQFIDATYEGDLMAAASVSYALGRESKKHYGESLAGHQFPKKPVMVSPLDATGKPLPLLTADSPGEDNGDEKIMTYSFRVVISTDPNNQLPMPEPAAYDPDRFELARRYIKANPGAAGQMVSVDGYPLPGKKVDLNNGIGRQISAGLVGASWAWPEASYSEREKIWEAHKQYTLELIWFLKTDPVVPEDVRRKFAAYALAKDEFQQYGGWPPALYVREGRRMIGEHVLTQHDVRTNPNKKDSIGISSFPIDSHDCQRVPTDDGRGWINEGTIFPQRINGNRHGHPYQVPYRSLTPRRSECVNLLVPVCLSSSHVGLSSIRVEPTWMMLGQSAGVAAAMAHETRTDVQALPYDKLKQRLLKQKQVIDFPAGYVIGESTSSIIPAEIPGIVLDDRVAKKTGTWKKSQNFRPYVGDGYIHDDNSAKGTASLTFETKISQAGRYDLRLAYSPHPTRASNVPMTLLVGGKRQKIAVNQRLPLDPGSRFRTLTTLDLQAGQSITIQLGNEGTDGFVVVDALQLLKHREAPTKKLPIKGEVFSIKDRTAFLILPEKPQTGRPIPWVWYAPTLPGLPGGAEKWMFEKFLESGIAIAGVDVGESYGSPSGRAIYTALHDELVKKRGLAKQACLLTRSRGGLMLYCWAVENPGKVKCITGIYPVCNIASYPGVERASGAYGLTAEQLKDELAKHNPIDRLAPLARAKVPIFHIHGDQDRVVPLEANSGLVKKRYDKLGGEMTLEVVKGQGHNLWAGWFNSQELVDFILVNAAR